MNAPIAIAATQIRAVPDRELEPGEEPTASSEGEVNQDDVDKLVQQHRDTREAIEKLTGRVDNAIRMGGENQAELFGGFGNLGLSQKVSALVESNKSTRRELRITRSLVRSARADVREDLKELRAHQLTLIERVLIALACLSLVGWVVLQAAPQFFPGGR